MIQLKRTNSKDSDFVRLVKSLDEDLQVRDGDEHSFFAQFNKIDLIQNVVVAYNNGKALGCGAIKPYNNEIMEVKRMFVSSEARGKGIATLILKELEKWAQELNYNGCILETGEKQPEAIGLYVKSGYERIPNYGPYVEVNSSFCFRKKLS
ncbi:GNAT family N-acetyltransferase [Xanthovirga aplysinae]|uniref:GNAT family N-acetyltransferase n=1 Tax=Xanthovirga aplysinae TaxID=2529853 RepID=UPI0012BD4332|nr:GNAT family N-acetyltransferase [Xanthovirga aplysinae]MTI31394.1 GNAT family N-acetyltransferase [Xanthovirga aplysinae]